MKELENRCWRYDTYVLDFEFFEREIEGVYGGEARLEKRPASATKLYSRSLARAMPWPRLGETLISI